MSRALSFSLLALVLPAGGSIPLTPKPPFRPVPPGSDVAPVLQTDIGPVDQGARKIAEDLTAGWTAAPPPERPIAP